MRGADGFAKLFETGQYGRLYIVSASRGCDAIFRLFVLPAGERATSNGPCNAPLNCHAMEVYDIADEQPGGTASSSSYGCSLEGDWQQDFASLVEARCAAIDAQVLQRGNARGR